MSTAQLLAEARARRGLPDYARPEPKPAAPAPPARAPAGWAECRTCKEEFPASEFAASGNAYDGRPRVCNACFLARYPKRTVPCTGGCGGTIETRGKGAAPMCRACRRARRDARAAAEATRAPRPARPTSCAECGRSLAGRRRIGERCSTCYHRDWRHRTGRSVGTQAQRRLSDVESAAVNAALRAAVAADPARTNATVTAMIAEATGIRLHPETVGKRRRALGLPSAGRGQAAGAKAGSKGLTTNLTRAA